jgi:large subunit ribosomal protein L30
VARKKGASGSGQLRIKQVRSGVGKPHTQRATLKALGLRHHQASVIKPDNPAIRGMIFHVRHLIEVSEVAQGEE